MSMETGYVGTWHQSPRRSGKTRYSLCDCYMESKLNWDKFAAIKKRADYPESFMVELKDKNGKLKEVPFWRPNEINDYFDKLWETDLANEQAGL